MYGGDTAAGEIGWDGMGTDRQTNTKSKPEEPYKSYNNGSLCEKIKVRARK